MPSDSPDFVPSSKTRTSNNSPLRIATVDTPHGGVIGMTLCPGKQGAGVSGTWARSLEADLAVVRDWGARAVLTLMEVHELERYGVAEMPIACRTVLGPHGWFHLPIEDGGVPDADFETAWQALSPAFHLWLRAGDRILVHCLGGLGRTGLVACRLLAESGVPPRRALERVRTVRPGTVETRAQEGYVLRLPGATG
ncbi:cyclin-dependent kinase inhibitor 3 family protein [Arhodomonas sp. SL1]|uniref:cyclin-dependent kinase inhibitor 3 family protein n=1 Tax=Arhodomonas sp. SL1 TaxID=3425691 RepID=UPI003F881F5E